MKQKARRPKRIILVACLLVVFTACISIGVKLRRYHAAYDAVLAAGGDIKFQGPNWVRHLSANRPVPYFDQVKSVDLSDRKLTAEQTALLIKGMAQFPNLESLNLAGTPCDDTAAAHFYAMGTQLKTLDLSWTTLGDKGVESLSRFTNLTSLDLSNTQVTDKGLSPLRSLQHLEVLYFDNTAVSDKGISVLKQISTLRELNVSNTDVTDEGVEEFKKELPDAEIYDD
jgi:hypothetical protein